MRFVIVHYHILKNAGSTIEDILDQSFGERFARFDRTERDAVITPAELLDYIESHPSLTAVSSHQIRYPLPEKKGILFYDICFLRDPVDRVRSMYDYYRQSPDPGDPVSDLANTRDPGGFVAGMVRENPLQIRNVQVNLIACAGDSDEPNRADLELAAARMRDASFPGVVDCFDESIRAGEYFLRQVFSELNCSLPPVNVSAGLGGTVESRTARLREACDPEIFAELLRLNELDFELVERTRAEVRRRAALIRPEPAPRSSGQTLFDAAFYLRKNPDVAAAGIDPWKHYQRHGAAEGRKPHPWFQPEFYRKPLEHFLRTGVGSPHRLFDANACPDPVGFLTAARTGGQGIEIDDVVLRTEEIGNPPEHLKRFLEATNTGQIRANLK
ncbi:MAG TPA: hypothetical protein VEF06_08745 [Bryobacteraceae bacterium]|nr:hypothetical protein [Bryobacteraceae bacterium]